MDTTRMDMMLDRVREEQFRQGAMLLDIAERQEEGLRLLRGIIKLIQTLPPPKERKTIPLPPGIMSTGLQYLAATAALLYMLRGGDLEKLAGLVKLLGLS